MANVSVIGGSAPALEHIIVTDNGHYEPSAGYDGFADFTVQLPLDDITIQSNGEYLADDYNLRGFDKVKVNVPAPTLISKYINQNGIYYAQDDNATGYSIVNVEVPTGSASYGIESYKGSNTFTSEVYTSYHNERVLAINIEIIGEAGTGHTTAPTITTSGSVITTSTVFTSYGSNDNRDCTIVMTIIDNPANSTITFGNISRTTYINKYHIIIPFDNSYNTITNTVFDTITDSARDDSKVVALPTGLSVALAAGVRGYTGNNTITGTSITGSGLSDLITYDHMTIPYGDIVLGFFKTSDNTSSVTLNTSAQINYASKIYGVWNFTTV